MLEGHAFSPDTPWQQELEASFPYVETPDQAAAMQEVKADMESGRPMDRLVCGDVGYGKTEMAIRAAFKAVMDGKQVAVLVPTTVLAQQHYQTFCERLAGFPVRVEMLSRFRSDKEQRDGGARPGGRARSTSSSARTGCCSETSRFQNLGLVIIDEEQRFGVAHKERLKQMRQQVDVLTLTATPIPRTLHMALGGIRDMSVMDTPPEDRLPIKTYVLEFDEHIVRDAILRELERKGQVYFVHNRVLQHRVDRRAGCDELVPEAEIAVAPRPDAGGPARTGDARLRDAAPSTCWSARRSSSPGSTSPTSTRSSSTRPTGWAWRSSTSCAAASAGAPAGPTPTSSTTAIAP